MRTFCPLYFFHNMLLTVDAGNTSIKFGVFNEKALVNRFALPTVRGDLTPTFTNLEKFLPEKVDSIIISSVVPEIETEIREKFFRIYGIDPVSVDHSFDFGFSVKYFPENTCGIDRLVAAFAAKERVGIPVIVCDFGTAVTIDAVNAQNEYIGGVIFPGPKTMAESLSSRSSKLPAIEIAARGDVFGNTTVTSIQSGVLFAVVGAAEGVILRMKEKMGNECPVIATGGFAKLIAQHTVSIDRVEENLILEGLRDLFERSADRK